MTSIGQHLRDVESATEAAERPSVRHALSTSKKSELRQFLLDDPYAFAFIICGHRELVPEVHMPISYMACGKPDKLAWALTQSGFDGFLIDQLRTQLRIREIDPLTDTGLAALDAQLDWVNFRLPRGSYKSSVITHAGAAYTMTVDSNTTGKITTAIDEKAWELCGQIGDTIRSGIYRDHFPERVPEGNLLQLITEKRITLGGRTVSRPQTTLQAGGYLTKDIGGHYDRFWVDDLVVGGKSGNNTPNTLPGVHAWLTGMSGYFILSQRVRRVHVGTRWEDDDDHGWLTSGKRARACLSVEVPIEVHDGEVINILERGKPTMPTFLPSARIQSIQDSVLSDESESEGAQSWRCNYLLNPSIGGGRLFPANLVNDPDRWWRGPYENSDPKIRKQYPNRFKLARLARDEQGRPVDKDKKPLIDAKGVLLEEWRNRAAVLAFDPWVDLDRVMTLDPSWAVGGDNWAITAAGIDSHGVMYQLETQSAKSGMSGWMEALVEMDEIYRPRIIGFDKGGYQDPMIQNILKTDRHMRRLRNKIVAVPHNNIAKKARIRAGVAEPFRMFRWQLCPDDHGNATRDEMKGYKGDPNAVDGILDSLAMVPTLSRRVKSTEDVDDAKARAIAREKTFRNLIDPSLGVPYAA